MTGIVVLSVVERPKNSDSLNEKEDSSASLRMTRASLRMTGFFSFLLFKKYAIIGSAKTKINFYIKIADGRHQNAETIGDDDQPKYSRRRTALPAGAKFNV